MLRCPFASELLYLYTGQLRCKIARRKNAALLLGRSGRKNRTTF
jgi:hypothetical protein